MTIVILSIIGVAALAFANGANDVSKGVATLTGTGRASYRAALAWGTVWTLAGGLASLGIAFGLVKAFTSAIVTVEMLNAPTFPVAVALGAAAWVLYASRTGLPVSTTHALTGAIVGVAVTVGGIGAVNWPILLAAIVAPLALSPAVAAAIAYATSAATRRLSPACVCVEPQMIGVLVSLPVSTTHVATGAIVGAGLRQEAGAVEWCALRSIAAAWVITVPAAAVLAAAVVVIGRAIS